MRVCLRTGDKIRFYQAGGCLLQGYLTTDAPELTQSHPTYTAYVLEHTGYSLVNGLHIVGT